MKKLFLALILSVFFAGTAHSAMTCTNFCDYNDDQDAGRWIVTCTADATPATMSYTFDRDEQKCIDGKWATALTIDPGTIGPKDDSDLAITDGTGWTLVSASTANSGRDNVDETVTRKIRFLGPGNAADTPVMSRDNLLTYVVTNNDVVSSSVTFIMDLAGKSSKDNQ